MAARMTSQYVGAVEHSSNVLHARKLGGQTADIPLGNEKFSSYNRDSPPQSGPH